MPITNKIKNIVLTAGGGTENLSVTDTDQLYIISGTGTLAAGVVIQHSGTPSIDMTYKFLYKATMTYSGSNKVTIMGHTLTQEEANGQGVIEANWNGASWDVYMYLDTTEEPIGLSGVATTTWTNAGGTVNLDPALHKKYQRFIGSATLIGSYVIQQDAGASPIDGDEFYIIYDATMTLSGNTITIFGNSLTAAQALSGNILVKAVYDSTAGAWNSIVITDSITYDANKVLASATDTTPNYLDGKVAKSVVVTSDKIELSGDLATPTNEYFYGMRTGAKGWFPILSDSLWEAGAGTYSVQQVNVGSPNDASGDYSLAAGNSTTASGDYSFSHGITTVASGDSSHAEGSGVTTASGDGSHAEGLATLASGNYSHSEGSSTVASAENSHAEGLSTTASGINSHAEGSGTIASGAISHAEGVQSHSYWVASKAISSGKITTTGDRQKVEICLQRNTTDATPVNLQDNASGEGLLVQLDSAWNFRIMIIAVQSGGAAGTVGDTFQQNIEGCIKNDAGTVSLVDIVTATTPKKDVGFLGTVDVLADVGNAKLQIEVTGELNKNISWLAYVEWAMLGFRNFTY